VTTKELTAIPTLAARGITVGPIPATDVEAFAGDVTLVSVEGGQRADFLSLMLSGRMSPKAGVVELDGREDPKGLRKRVAIVDAPDTSAPADELPLDEVVMEELVFAGLRAPRRAMRKLLADEGLTDLASTTIGHLPAEVRTRVLTRTAAADRHVDILILATPDRHGGDTAAWADTARAWAARGYTVIVLGSAAAIDAAR